MFGEKILDNTLKFHIKCYISAIKAELNVYYGCKAWENYIYFPFCLQQTESHNCQLFM